MATRLEAVLFDLDGTLIDSIPLILASFRHAVEAHGLDHVRDADLMDGLGTPLREHMARLARDADAVDQLVETYRAYNHAEHDAWVVAFEGVAAALDELASAGVPLGIVTSKRVEMARRGLAVAGLGHDFRVLIGPDEVTRPKPHPEPLLLAARHLDLAPERVAYVGDSPHDLAAARAAGMVAVGAGWGPFERARLDAERPRVVLDRPHEIVQLVELVL